MKKILSVVLNFLKIFAAFILYKISKGKIQTRTAQDCRKRCREENQKRINEMQAALDAEHAKLRGWTNATRHAKVEYDEKREKMLAKEIARTHELMTAQA